MLYGLLADLVVAVHLAYVGYIVLGLALLLVGVGRGWAWVRNPWFRVTHLAAILIVFFELLVGAYCPLTRLEMFLRSLSGGHAADASFVSRLMYGALGQIPAGLTDALYYFFALLTAAAFVLAPPRLRRAGRLR